MSQNDNTNTTPVARGKGKAAQQTNAEGTNADADDKWINAVFPHLADTEPPDHQQPADSRPSSPRERSRTPLYEWEKVEIRLAMFKTRLYRRDEWARPRRDPFEVPPNSPHITPSPSPPETAQWLAERMRTGEWPNMQHWRDNHSWGPTQVADTGSQHATQARSLDNTSDADAEMQDTLGADSPGITSGSDADMQDALRANSPDYASDSDIESQNAHRASSQANSPDSVVESQNAQPANTQVNAPVAAAESQTPQPANNQLTTPGAAAQGTTTTPATDLQVTPARGRRLGRTAGTSSSSATGAPQTPVLVVGNRQLAPAVTGARSRSILDMPGSDVPYVRNRIHPEQILSRRLSYINAILIQSRGVAPTQPCDSCRAGRLAPFTSCRHLPDHFGGACANCKWRDLGKRCSLNPQASVASTSTTTAEQPDDGNDGDAEQAAADN
ncbi:hypothetical protein AYL99_11752 [Fonsecaea erecta]|uniref:Uncharacterized protein n=1 Tax=Fonsecaea erecta TaxID=1367422 RepID=A0A178Z2J2_9EURO|nr:hypothetical protein AYL99_11752 [Fonsecaea erecta]OAP53992.1 hypothetical protein AYL99_11752 [Fonsecaea erecta]